MTEVAARLAAMEERLDRLERLAFLGFQDARAVADYAYQGFQEEPGDVKRLSWTNSHFHALSDQELASTGASMPELAALKMMYFRGFLAQTRRDVLAIAIGLTPKTKEAAGEEEAAA